ncbi:uncharacterized protein A1O9_01046 [Exophiala aquamarina CBS 119918]|uniref:NAD(P)-binding domain-containing protein n=1 Tax=Exophiala aquamarina CBS 119918 TaxID=1182545 RepID=A0A072Q565_9EURO|nr:uncharacterized protein A1O9_01046 [Exophiala aquamarina CBS 119918]KEF63070.1 hypothetical protein A1O9_01046 [Exophiala aquamarina CBS 119918]
MECSARPKVTLLILGAGWTYQFLQPVLEAEAITYTATTTSGHDKTIAFRLDPDSDDLEPFKTLPNAEFVLITFPLRGRGLSTKLLSMYHKTHDHTASSVISKERDPRWIQLGSTGIYTHPGWSDESSPIDETNDRAIAEMELIELGGCVMNLAGLYGSGRQPKNWVSRVAKTKEQLAGKGALHLIHGRDVARGLVGVIKKSTVDDGHAQLFGRRWIVADGVSYDWWTLVWNWMGHIDSAETKEGGDGEPGEGNQQEEKSRYRRWVLELMDEQNVKALPRDMELLGRKLDSRAFWRAIDIVPEMSLAG